MRKSLFLALLASLISASPSLACGNPQAYKNARIRCAHLSGQQMGRCVDNVYLAETNDYGGLTSCAMNAFSSGMQGFGELFKGMQ